MNDLKLLTKAQKSTLQDIGWLASCTADFREAFLNIGGVKVLETGDELYRDGQISTHVYGLIEGQVDVHLTATNGEELVYPFTAPGRWYGLADVVAGIPAFGKAVAGTRSVTMCFSKQEILGFLDADPKRYRNIIAHEFVLRRLIQETVADLVTSDGLELVGRRLVRMVEFEGVDFSTGVAISQFAFATAAGVSVPTVQRAFKELKRYGAIETSYGKIQVTNFDKLKSFVISLSE
ncbi:MAG: Crp/Fnr family transcriptional regulator [Roseibium album]|uniref:Crp/Fnr family transcriptional regulator n=1 Tax=Roseibium album TaxID=311410 RepID=UPI0032EC813F